jgi:hypothetical protein
MALKGRRGLLRWWTDALASFAYGTRPSHSDQSNFAKFDRIGLSARGERKKLFSEACFNSGSALDFGQAPNCLVKRTS